MKFLIVDNEYVMHDLYDNALETARVQCFFALDLDEMRWHLDGEQFDLLIIDFDLCAEMDNADALAALPVIVVYPDGESFEATTQPPPYQDNHLVRPFTLPNLHAAIADLLPDYSA